MAVYRAYRPINGLHGNEVSVQKCHLDDRYERNECGLGSLVHREFTDTARLLNRSVMARFSLV